MILAIDKKGQLWRIDAQGNYVIHNGSATDAVVIQADFEDGFTATLKDFEITFGIRNYDMRVSAQSTTYELTVTELISLMAKELNVGEDRITLRFKTRDIDDRFGNAIQETYAVEVIVSGPSPTQSPTQ